MRLFVSYSHKRGFGNVTIESGVDLVPRGMGEVEELQEVIAKEQEAEDPIILWWRVLDDRADEPAVWG